MMRDGTLHMICCCAIAVTLMAAWRIAGQELWLAAMVSAAAPSLIGVCKEWGDSLEPGNRWDWHDIRDNEIGAAVGIAVGCLFWLI